MLRLRYLEHLSLEAKHSLVLQKKRIFLPIFLIIYNFSIESDNWVHIRENLLGKYIFSTICIVLGVSALSTIIGVGSAWYVTCHDFRGRKTLEWILILPMTIPTYIAAYAYYDILELLNPLFNWF